MLKKLSFASGLVRRSASPSASGEREGDSRGKIIKYSSKTSKGRHHHHRGDDDDDDLDEVAVISSAAPESVTYGSGDRPSRSSLSTNGPPRLVPGIITSTGFESKPYVPATCTMQPKISSSVIQSTAGGAAGTSLSSSSARGGFEQSTSSSKRSNLAASTSRTGTGTRPASASDKDVEEGHRGPVKRKSRLPPSDKKGKELTAMGSEEEGEEVDRLQHGSGSLGVRKSLGEDEEESHPLLSAKPIQTISSKVTSTGASATIVSSAHHLRSTVAPEDQVPTSPTLGHPVVMPSSGSSHALNVASPFTSGGFKKGTTTIFTSTSSGSPAIIKGGGNVLTTMSTSSEQITGHETTQITKKVRDARRKEIKKEFDKNWVTGTIEKSGCNWTFVFDPSGRLVYFWSMIVSLAFVYNSWVITYRFAFDEINSETVVMWLSLDGLSDIIYILDVAIHFRIGYLEEGVLQTNPAKLRQHYMNSTLFYIDCLCLLPLDFLYLSIGFNSMLRCFRLVKIYRFWAFMDRTERHTNYPNVFRTLSLFHYILVLFHWNACLYHLISTRGGFGSSDWFEGSRDREQCSDVDCDYLHAFYWSTLALTTIGDLPRPRTKGEYLFLIVELVLGLFILATVLGHVANIVTNVSAARKEFQAKLDAVKTYMRMRRVPEHLKIKVIKWFDYLWMTQKSSDEEKSVGFLPAKLKAEIAIHVHLDTLKRVEIFQNTEAGFLCALVLRLKPVLFSPSDYVCRKGEIGKEMYIVNRGRLQVVADNGKTVLATLRAGSYFGEISILNMGTAGNRRTASVRSVGYSDLFCLNKNDMWDVLKDYPAARVRLEAIAVKRLEKYRKEPLKKISMGRSRSTPGLVESKSQLNLNIAAGGSGGDKGGGSTGGPGSSTNIGGNNEEKELPGNNDTDTVTTNNQTFPGNSERSLQSFKTSGLAQPSESSTSTSPHLPLYQYPLPPNFTSSSGFNQQKSPIDSYCSPHPPTYAAIQSPYHTTGPSSIAFTTFTTSYSRAGDGSQLTYSSGLPQPPSPQGTWHERRTSSPSLPPPTVTMTSSTGFDSSANIRAGGHTTVSPAQSVPLLAPVPTIGAFPQSSRAELNRTPIPGELSQELLISEIKRLREKLQSLETDNTSMALRLSQQNIQMESRLAEIESHLQTSSSQLHYSTTSSQRQVQPPQPLASSSSSSQFSPIVTISATTTTTTPSASDKGDKKQSPPPALPLIPPPPLSPPTDTTSPTPSTQSSSSSTQDDSERNKESII